MTAETIIIIIIVLNLTSMVEAAEEIKKPEPLKVSDGEEEIKLTQLDIKLKVSLEDRQKYQVIFDSTGECEVFFRYKAHMVELNKL
jgi:hypothetical protein